jgi:hypothetical protein
MSADGTADAHPLISRIEFLYSFGRANSIRAAAVCPAAVRRPAAARISDLPLR